MSLDGRASSILFASPAKLILQAASGTNPKRIFSSALGPVDRHDRGHISLGLRFARGFQACGHKCDPPRQVTPVVGFADGAPVGLRRGVRGFCPCHDLNIDTNAAGRTVEGKDSNHRGLDAEPTVHPDRPCYGEGWAAGLLEPGKTGGDLTGTRARRRPVDIFDRSMRLADFILANVEPILAEWEAFARSIWPDAAAADPAELRDEAEDILRATVFDMQSAQTSAQQAEKSKGTSPPDERGDLTVASSAHGAGRVASGFDLWAVIAEYRALRASVLRLWRESGPAPDLRDVDDLTRFNESIDQSLTHAVRSYAHRAEQDRAVLLAKEQASRREAEAANRAKDVFLATLSHEMRTPLNAIVGWLGILRHEDAEAKHFDEALKVIERNTRAQVQLIDDVLDVSRIVSGKLRVDIRPCELTDVITAGVNVVRPAAEARGITLTVHLDPSVSGAWCDSVRIQQVVWNLVSNAVKFTPKGGRVDVTLTREQSSFQLQVRDNGQGISPELLPRIFDRFRQADSSTRRRFAGLGLGLSIVKHIVEAHGGTVEATSQGEGKGSTFTVRLPVRAVMVGEQPAKGNLASDAGEDEPEGGAAIGTHLPLVRLDGLRVLVVDDDADARRVLVMVLEQAGAAVTAADSVREAMEALPVARPDVLVSDLGMPDQDGCDLIRQVRDSGHDATNLPAVALTAFVQEDDARLALLAGFQVHVSKPIDPHDLTSVIARLTGRSSGDS
jgi:signal transduction histidine kinase/CheY-like chemotaxis protein